MAQSESLQFYVGALSGGTLVRNSRITKISSASINLQLNNSGTIKLVIDKSDPALGFFQTLVTSILMIYREGVLVWSGPVWIVDESYSGSARKITVTAVGWFELLNHRLIRSTPGYLLITSLISVTDPGFESAISGWTETQFDDRSGGSGGQLTGGTTTTRDTTRHHTGSASLLWAESSPSFSLNTAAANLLGSTPTNGKRYRLNFWAEGLKTPSDVGCKIPYLEVLEGGSRVAVQTLTGLFNDANIRPIAESPNSTDTIIPNAGSPIASYSQQYVEWVSTGVTTTFRLGWDLMPSQLNSGSTIGGQVGIQNSTTGWNEWGGNGSAYVVADPSLGFLIASNGQSINLTNNSWSGTFTAGRSYTVYIEYANFLSPSTSANPPAFSINSSSGGGQLGAVGISNQNLGARTATSFTFTADSSPAPFFEINGNWVGGFAGSDALHVYIIQISENGTDTDPLLSIDDLTLQEYQGDGIYNNLDAGSIVSALLSKVNADASTPIVPGSLETTALRTITYQQFQNVGSAITSLSNIEDGFDFWVDPVTRNLNVYNRTNATNFPDAVAGAQAGAFGTFLYSADRTSVLRFEYAYGSDNLQSFQKTSDSSVMVNRLNVQGKYAVGFAEDSTSESTYGVFEDVASLPDVIDASGSVLPFYANAEVAFRKNPKVTYQIQTKTGAVTPRLFIDFNIGDRAMLNVGGSQSLSGGTLQQTIRIFGVQLDIDAQGNEKLSGLQLSAN